jgi:protein-tyrosine phosphatase
MGGPPSWVIERVLARSCRPGYPVEDVPSDAVERWIVWIKAMGIQGLICLLSHDELTNYGHVPGGLLAAYRRHDLHVIHLPIIDPAYRAHGRQELEDTLERIYKAFSKLPKPVVIHCNAGAVRTGAAVQYIQRRLDETRCG